MTPAETVAQALAGTPVFDGHNDLPYALRQTRGYSVAGLGQIVPGLQTDLVRLRQGGVGAQFWSVWVPSTLPEPEAVVSTLEQIDCVYRLAAAYPADLKLVNSAAGVKQAWAEGKIASLIGIEGGHSLAESLGVLRMMARLGVRYVTLTHGNNTRWADSATDQPNTRGLSDTGRAIVKEMNRLGVIVDLSHVSHDTMRAALAATDVPVLFSHSSAFALGRHQRDVPDDVLERLPANGGVVQATFVAGFLSEEREAWAHAAFAASGESSPWRWADAPRPGETYDEARARNAAAAGPQRDIQAYLAAYAAEHPRPPVTVELVADHVDHLREVAGVDHVGLGGDYDGTFDMPEGMEDVSGYPRLLECLAGRGWSKADLEKLAGGNVLRVVQAAEDAADDFTPCTL